MKNNVVSAFLVVCLLVSFASVAGADTFNVKTYGAIGNGASPVADTAAS